MCTVDAVSTNGAKSVSLSKSERTDVVTTEPTKSSSKDETALVEGITTFHWTETDPIHFGRRKEILAKYPEIKELYGYCPKLKYTVTFVVVLQTICAASVNWVDSWLYFCVLAYVVGGTANQCLMMSLHELGHNLGFRSPRTNRWFSLFANLPLGIPAAISFRRYHVDHHKYLGEETMDVDVPTAVEAMLFHTTITKLIFVILYGFFYAFRPLLTNPKKPGNWEGLNWATCIIYDSLILYFFGLKSLIYLLVGTFMGSGLHPVAGHFIAEHYIFTKGNETYSYYGILNWFTFNVGYHNEHHDFPNIPASRLPKLYEIAKEYYGALPQHKSWTWVIYKFITDPNMSGFSRIKRRRLAKNKLKET